MHPKKVITMITCFAMVSTLAACGGGASSSSLSTDDGAPSAASSSASEASEASKASASSFSVSASSVTSASTLVSDTNGDDDIVIALLMKSMASEWNQNIEDSLKKLGEEKGFEVLTFDADGDSATQMDQLNDAINQGVDGIFMHIADEGIAEAAAEAAADAGVPMIGESLPIKDGDGNWLDPCVVLNAAGCGTVAADWVADNWESTSVDLSNPSSVGVVLVTNSLTENAVLRHEGAMDELEVKFPDIPESNYYIAYISASSSEYTEGGYNETSAVLTAHQDMKSWIVIGVMDDYALGACRAIEENGNADNTILVSMGGEQAIPEWEGGTTSPWYATVYYTAMDFAESVVDGLLSVITGACTLEEVFSDNIDEGQTYGTKTISGTAITYENYKDYVK